MCGRYVLFTQRWKAAQQLSFAVRDQIDGAEGPRYNVALGTHVPVILHRKDEDEASFETVWWGYYPHWAVSKETNRVGNDHAGLVEPANPA